MKRILCVLFLVGCGPTLTPAECTRCREWCAKRAEPARQRCVEEQCDSCTLVEIRQP